MPVAEHPYEPSWGYQVTGFYAPTSRFGDPDDFRWFVDHLHQRGVGVIVDWVPAHFPRDEGALARFDGAPLYEHVDPGRAAHPDWGTLVFDHTRPEVRAFLTANALYWLGELHVDGLRVDAVASMLYLDYSRGPGDWTPNEHGGNEDLGAVAFLQELNTVVHAEHPGVLTIAEESTAWPGVSRPVDAGGLGFTHKWNMGWMHDTLDYWSTDPLHRHERHNRLTFGLTYAWAEHFVLPLSHDEVVHLKKPLLGKMPGPTTQPGSPTCARCTRGCGPIPASSCSSWAASWPSPTSGPTSAASTGASSSILATPVCSASSATSTPSRSTTPPCSSPTATRPASPGSRSTTRPTTCSPSSGDGPAPTR